MLIELADELANPGEIGLAQWCHALANLARSHFEGKHFILGSPRLLARLSSSTELDATLRGRFKEIRERTNDAHELRGEARVLLQVHASQDSLVVTDERPERTIYRVGLAWFVDSGRTQAMRLLAENPSDAEFYQLAVQALIARRARRGVSAVLRLSGGGGSTTAPQLRLIASEGGIVCVVDNDRKHVKDGIGDTARKALEALAEVRQRGDVAAVLVLPCRTIENLLPASLVLDALPRTTAKSVRGRFIDAEQRGSLGGGGFEKLKDECAEDMLACTLAHAKQLSSHKLAEYLYAETTVRPMWIDLAETLMHWGLAPPRSHL